MKEKRKKKKEKCILRYRTVDRIAEKKKIGQNLKLKSMCTRTKLNCTDCYKIFRDEMRRTGTRTDRHKDGQTDKQGMDDTVRSYDIRYDK